MDRHDLHAEREWIAYMAERNERARRLADRRRPRVPRDRSTGETLLIGVAIVVVNVAVIGMLLIVGLR